MTDKALKTVSLVLGSGGARGLAHIGVIDWLSERGYRIESIAGSSMGALIGGIYAAGQLETYKQWVSALHKTDVIRFLDFAFSPGGLFKGDRIMDTLRSMVGEHAIEQLPVDYTAVATDIERQREVWITEGPLFDAIRASIAVPSIFTPHEYLGMKLVDGGLLNPVPIAPTFKDFTDLTIAVNLNGGARLRSIGKEAGTETEAVADADAGYRNSIAQFLDTIQDSMRRPATSDVNLFELLNRCFETMQKAVSALKLAAYAPDIVIDVPQDACASYEFYRAKEIIELGYRCAEVAIQHRARGD